MGVIWHDLECGAYAADLPLWRALVAEHDGPILDVGAGTGRVTLDLARRGHDVIALDRDPAFLATLVRRAEHHGLTVRTLTADARAFALGPDETVGLILVPMQTLQLLGGPDGRAAFFACAARALKPGGLLVAALADALDGFDEDHQEPPLPDIRETPDGTVYASRVVLVRPEPAGVRIGRIRETVDPHGHRIAESDELVLDHASAASVAAEAEHLGLFRAQPARAIAETDEHVGSEVVVLCRS